MPSRNQRQYLRERYLVLVSVTNDNNLPEFQEAMFFPNYEDAMNHCECLDAGCAVAIARVFVEKDDHEVEFHYV